jgi:uncharacterized BrkB/YihY/UPF0761 family membrane protein
MAFFKSLLAGVATVVLVAFAVPFVMVVYLWIRRPAGTGSDSGTVGWDPISLAKPAPLLIVIGIFLAGFVWEYFRATRK